MINKSECFAYIPFGSHGRCAVLSGADCDCCSFFKTREQYQEDLVKYPPDMLKFVPRRK